VTELLNQSGGIVKTYRYDAFGNILQETGPTWNRGFTYTGRERHYRSGLYYYRARWYDAQTGRFITQDPILWGGGINLYGYVGNNPVNYYDPYGLSEVYIEINRLDYLNDCVIGKITVDSVPLGYTLELPWKGNRKYVSRIPAGSYFAEIHDSDHFGPVLKLQDVPGRDAILLHWGVWPKNTEGCPLVSKGRDTHSLWPGHQAVDDLMHYVFNVMISDAVVGERTYIKVMIK
jgi:RHS repeat-associated protein